MICCMHENNHNIIARRAGNDDFNWRIYIDTAEFNIKILVTNTLVAMTDTYSSADLHFQIDSYHAKFNYHHIM